MHSYKRKDWKEITARTQWQAWLLAGDEAALAAIREEGIPRSTVSRWRRGGRVPSVEQAERLIVRLRTRGRRADYATFFPPVAGGPR
jgi:hypothetical protein